MSARTFEDLRPGLVAETGPYEVTRDAVIGFAQHFDPQAFHLDEAAGMASPLGALSASGWHTGAMGMRLFYDGFVSSIASMGSPGITELSWLKPVRPGNILHARIEVTDARVSASRPEMGLLGILLTLTTGAGTRVMTQRFPIMVARRGFPQVAASRAAVSEDPRQAGTILGAETFTAEAIVAFARDFDPQPFHLDEAAGRHSHFGALVASGWHVGACWMKHMIAIAKREADYAGRISPGFRNMRWHAPVRAGDTITFTTHELKTRPVARAGWVLATTANAGFDQHGRRVFSFDGATLKPRAIEPGARREHDTATGK